MRKRTVVLISLLVISGPFIWKIKSGLFIKKNSSVAILKAARAKGNFAKCQDVFFEST